jgi:4-amino-4-deoxy-L-arabinose transferase-like glycosyltransferase
MSRWFDLRPWLVWVSLWLVIGLMLAGSWYWVVVNQVILGHDGGGHLERSLEVADLLQPLTPQSVFRALTFHHYRPPAFYLATQPFYWLFGRSADTAQLVNLFLLAVVIYLTFLLGRALANEGVGLLAALLTALFPMIAAMTRLYYMENLITSMVILNLLALIKSEQFSRRGWSWLWGVSFGLGMLTKWTYPIYVLLPALVIIGSLIIYTLRLRRFTWRLDIRRGVGALLLAVGLALFLRWLNGAQITNLLLGNWLVLVWTLLLIPLCYASLQPSTPITNGVIALFAALLVSSFWYATRIEFFTDLWDAAFGTYRGHYEAANPLRLWNYVRYPRYLVYYDIGPLLAYLMLPVGLWPWLWRLTRWVGGWRAVHPAAWVLWGSVALAFAVLSQTSQDTERNLAPLLPVIALLLSDGLRHYTRPLAYALAALWLGVAVWQYALYTFDGLTPLRQRTAHLWAVGEFLAAPASDLTNPGYWVAPDVLATINPTSGPPASFGMLVDSLNIHRGPFEHLVHLQRLNIVTMALAVEEEENEGDLFANQWVLVKDGDNHDVGLVGQAMIRRVLSGDPLFHQLYREVRRYPLPNGETVFLYQRSHGPAFPYADPDHMAATLPVVEAINRLRKADAPLLVANAGLAVWLGVHRVESSGLTILPPSLSVEQMIGKLKSETFFVAVDASSAELEHQLDEKTYRALAIGGDQASLVIYGWPRRPLAERGVLGEWAQFALSEIATHPELEPGQVLPIQLQAAGQVDDSLKLSLRLVSEQDVMVAQSDAPLNYQMKLALYLPPDALAGNYRLRAVVYDPETMEPLVDKAGNQETALDTIRVQP